jgi:hypothetical protein
MPAAKAFDFFLESSYVEVSQGTRVLHNWFQLRPQFYG